ncbi:MAG: hypothetical protein WKG06_31765 [Segetibacter sp.]
MNGKTWRSWKKAAKQRLTERLAIPDIGGMPEVNVNKQYSYDGLHIEEISWQLPYGRPTEAILLKPLNAKRKLPGILAFHDHGGNKYFGCRKITKTSDNQTSIDERTPADDITVILHGRMKLPNVVMLFWFLMPLRLQAGG